MRMSNFRVSCTDTAQAKMSAVGGAPSHLGGGGVDLDGGRDALEHVAVTHRRGVLDVRLLGFGLSGFLVDGDVLVEQLVAVLETASAELVGPPVGLLALVQRFRHLHCLEVLLVFIVRSDLLYIIVALEIWTTSRFHLVLFSGPIVLNVVTLVTVPHVRHQVRAIPSVSVVDRRIGLLRRVVPTVNPKVMILVIVVAQNAPFRLLIKIGQSFRSLGLGGHQVLVGGIVLDLVHRAQFTARTRNVPNYIVDYRLIVLHSVVIIVSLLLLHCQLFYIIT